MDLYINIFVIVFLIIYLITTIFKKYMIENLYLKDQQYEDEAILQQADAEYVNDYVRHQQQAKEETQSVYNINTIPYPNNALPIPAGEGYNTIPSNLLRQAMNISGDRYK